ncbi:hypothetical protein ACWCP6_24065 [Streptomyces sp. NPDC002004]
MSYASLLEPYWLGPEAETPGRGIPDEAGAEPAPKGGRAMVVAVAVVTVVAAVATVLCEIT